VFLRISPTFQLHIDIFRAQKLQQQNKVDTEGNKSIFGQVCVPNQMSTD